MLRVMVEQKEVRNDALKVLSFAFTLYGEDMDLDSQLDDAATAITLVDDLNCLSIIFGFWAAHPENKLKAKESHSYIVNEHCLQIIWNLIRSLEKPGKMGSTSS